MDAGGLGALLADLVASGRDAEDPKRGAIEQAVMTALDDVGFDEVARALDEQTAVPLTAESRSRTWARPLSDGRRLHVALSDRGGLRTVSVQIEDAPPPERRQFLDAYRGETTEALLALEGRFRTDSLVLAFDEGLEQKEAEKGREALTPEERVVLAVEALEREVNNGGFDQFFLGAPTHASFVADALERIGRADAADVVRAALAALGLPEPVTVEAIQSLDEDLEAGRNEALDRCDERYHAEVGDLSEDVFRFIARNADRIRLPG